MANVERVYTIPLRDAYATVRQKRARRAVSIVQAFLQRHMKSDNVRISNALNSFLWRDGMQKPPRRVRIKAVKDDSGLVKAYLVDEKIEEKKTTEKKEEKKEEKPAEKKTITTETPKTAEGEKSEKKEEKAESKKEAVKKAKKVQK